MGTIGLVTVVPENIRVFMNRIAYEVIDALAELSESNEELRDAAVDTLCDRAWDQYGERYTREQRRAWARLVVEDLI